MSNQPLLSIVIPTHQRQNSLARLIASIAKQSLAPNKFEVIIAMNLQEPSDYLLKWKEKLSLNWYVSGKLGANTARNLGIAKAVAPIVLLLDDDVELADPMLLEKHLAFHQEHPEISGLGGGYTFPQELGNFSFAYHLIATSWLLKFRANDGSTPYLIGGHASYKRDLFQAGYGLNDAIVFGGTETEFNLRLFRAGKRLIYDPSLSVLHYAEITPRDLLRKAFLQGFNSCRRKQALDSPAPQLTNEEAIRLALSTEKVDRSKELTTKLANYLFDLAFQAGWREAKKNSKPSWRRNLFAQLIGAWGKFQK